MKEKKRVAESKATVREKRVRRMKRFILFGAVVLLFTSVLLNLILVFKVMRLEEQMDRLYSAVTYDISV